MGGVRFFRFSVVFPICRARRSFFASNRRAWLCIRRAWLDAWLDASTIACDCLNPLVLGLWFCRALLGFALPCFRSLRSRRAFFGLARHRLALLASVLILHRPGSDCVRLCSEVVAIASLCCCVSGSGRFCSGSALKSGHQLLVCFRTCFWRHRHIKRRCYYFCGHIRLDSVTVSLRIPFRKQL